MPRNITFFEEYLYFKDTQSPGTSPYLEEGRWFLDHKERTFDEIVKMCNIPESDSILLKIKYGCKDITQNDHL